MMPFNSVIEKPLFYKYINDIDICHKKMLGSEQQILWLTPLSGSFDTIVLTMH